MKTGVESYSCIFISNECTLFKVLDNYSNNFKCPNINSLYGVHIESFDFYIKRCFLVMAVDLGKGTL